MIHTPYHCGRLDEHPAHKWSPPRDPGWPHRAYRCVGAPVTEGGWTRCPGCGTSGRPHPVGGEECREAGVEKAISQGDE